MSLAPSSQDHPIQSNPCSLNVFSIETTFSIIFDSYIREVTFVIFVVFLIDSSYSIFDKYLHIRAPIEYNGLIGVK